VAVAFRVGSISRYAVHPFLGNSSSIYFTK
jgi:hypothetical protein